MMPEIVYNKMDSVRLSGDGSAVVIIDQTLLPNELKYLTLTTAEQMFEAIKTLRVRGAPAIGIFAGYAMAVLAKSIPDEGFMDELTRLGEYLISSRPTAVNLSWAVKRQLGCAARSGREGLADEAVRIHLEDIGTCKAIAEHGLSLLHEGDRVLTHCNAGALACSRYGTGLGALLLAAERGFKVSAVVDETRPLLQGARLTAYELHNAGIDVSLICDNMAAWLMSCGEIDAVMVGCDRVAANGDTANKIGTLGAAVAAHHFGVPFYVCCPGSTIDRSCKTGADIVVEERDGSEITELYFRQRTAPEGIGFRDPAFDVTPAELITAIITENGILRYPYYFG
ncbi:methylthioribose-1-phosphate isomerase [Ruminococcus sp. YE71]|uniref:S-methyl-5-thioribose-1-phosphate isomerase n=2 Tax=unclassified Ruminococcus TaxID=2608920 RepID=UPI000886B9C1|nr:methylthioribose-1-phosphate isomerase [Ruminococcus sp. YE78]SFW39858.1 methylthioribose-1-phosphate isomerase [Ruminococcus sp. YE71]